MFSEALGLVLPFVKLECLQEGHSAMNKYTLSFDLEIITIE